MAGSKSRKIFPGHANAEIGPPLSSDIRYRRYPRLYRPSGGIARILFMIFIVVFIVFLVLGLLAGETIF
jgi:hypothetical protein